MKELLEAIERRAAKPAAPTVEEPYYGVRDDEGKRPDLKRALQDFQYLNRNLDVVRAERNRLRLEAQEAEEAERFRQQRERRDANLARAQATRELEAVERQKKDDERSAAIEERMRQIREATE